VIAIVKVLLTLGQQVVNDHSVSEFSFDLY